MATVFISHVEEDQALAVEIAGGLERAGHSTWYYERDSSPGPSYLLQVNSAIEACQVVVLIISPRALESGQVTAEVVRAHETGKSFLPLRAGISHEEFRRRRPEWGLAIGAAASIAVPESGSASVLADILEGLSLLLSERARRDSPVAAAPVPVPAAPARGRAWTWGAGAVATLAVLLFTRFGPIGERPATVPGDAPQSAATSPAPPPVTPLDAVGTPDTGRASVTKADTPAAAAARRTPRDRAPSCDESAPGSARRVVERGRLEATDDVSGAVYAFVVCEALDRANGTVEMQIKSSNTVGTRWSSESAARKAADMELRGVTCEPTGQHAVRSTGAHDPRNIVFVVCQQAGAPTSLAVHATTRKADGSAYPEKVLRVDWPK